MKVKEYEMKPLDLSYLDLSYSDLSFANLHSANLRSLDLRFADLSHSDLSFANLRFANLRFANLRSADLRSADLTGVTINSNVVKIFTAGNSGRTSVLFIRDNKIMASIGCFYGTVDEALERIAKKYGKDSYYYKVCELNKKELENELG